MNQSVLVLLSLIGLWLAGCSWTGRDGMHKTVIVGFGIVTQTNDAGIAAAHTRVAGVVWGRQGAGLGLIRQHRVEIDPDRATNDLVALRVTPMAFSFTRERVTNSPNTKPHHQP